MFAEILSKKLEKRCKALAAPAALSVKVDGLTYSTTDWSQIGMSLNGGSRAFRQKEHVHGTIAYDGVSGPFSGEIVGAGADQPFDIRFRSLPANVLMMLNMARTA